VEHHSAVDKIILVLMVKEKGKDIRMRMAMEELRGVRLYDSWM
jgi:hypothetical protein